MRIVKPGQVIIDFAAEPDPTIVLHDFQISHEGEIKKQAVIQLLNKTRGEIARHIRFLNKQKGDVL